MDQRLSIITLGVADLKTSRAFYDALGWEVASEEQADQIVAYDLIGMTLCVYPLDKLAEDAKIEVQSQKYSTITLAYNVQSEKLVDDMLAQAVRAGGKLVKGAEKTFWGGYSGYFADSDGNLWEVAFNPFSKLGEKGEFRWLGYE